MTTIHDTVAQLRKELEACQAKCEAMEGVVDAAGKLFDAVAMGPIEIAATYGPDFDSRAHMDDLIHQYEKALAALKKRAG